MQPYSNAELARLPARDWPLYGPVELRLLATVDRLRAELAQAQRPALVLAYADGLVEAYGNRKTRIVVVPDCQSEANLEVAADCLVMQQPRHYQREYWPDKLVARAQVGACSVSSVAAGYWTKRLLAVSAGMPQPLLKLP